MTDIALKFAMWLFDAKMEELTAADLPLRYDRQKMATLSQLQLADSVLWAAFGRKEPAAKYDC